MIECEIEEWTDIPDDATHWVLISEGQVIKSFSSDNGGETWRNTTDSHERPDQLVVQRWRTKIDGGLSLRPIEEDSCVQLAIEELTGLPWARIA